MGLNLAGPSPVDAKVLKSWCVCCGRMLYAYWYVYLRTPGSQYPLHNAPVSLGMEFTVRTFFVITPNNIDGPCEYIALSMSKVEIDGSLPTGQCMLNCSISWKILDMDIVIRRDELLQKKKIWKNSPTILFNNERQRLKGILKFFEFCFFWIWIFDFCDMFNLF